MNRGSHGRAGAALTLLAGTIGVLNACGNTAEQGASPGPTSSAIAERYVKIALALRPYDEAYVDAYFGPAEWSDAAETAATPLDALLAETDSVLDSLRALAVADTDIERARRSGLEKRLASMRLRMRMAAGERLPFDEESRILFDAVAPVVDIEGFDDVIAEIDALLPGSGSLGERVNAFRERFTIPVDRLSAVFDAAIDECRRRTLEHIALPSGESFSIEYVTDKPWSGYNWYQGDNHSLIQINTDLPIFIDRAVDLGCHEGYPGHHTSNVLAENQLVAGRGWVEFSLFPLFGPLSLISEGSANYGIELAFPAAERREFEREILLPLAGIEAADLDRYHALLAQLERLDDAGVAIQREYLDGERSREDALALMQRYTLTSAERGAQRLDFVDTYRSYVINYTYGRDLVAAYLARAAGADRAAQWQAFAEMLSTPTTPSDLL